MADKLQHSSVRAGATSVSIPVLLRNTSDGLGKTGVAAGSVTARYWRQNGVSQTISVSALGGVANAYSSGGWIEVDSTAMRGVYRFDVPDAAFSVGADWVIIQIQVAGAYEFVQFFDLSSNALQTGDSYARIGIPKGASLAEDLNAGLLDVGTLQAGTTTSITLRAGAPNGIFPGRAMILITSGAASGETAMVDTYNPTTKVVTPKVAFTNAPGAGAQYYVIAVAPGDPAVDVNVVQVNGSAPAASALATAATTGLATTGAAMTLTSGERNAVADAFLDRSNGVETGLTPRQTLRLVASMLAGLLSGATAGAGSATIIIKDVNNTKTRITMQTDEAGNRSAVTLDLT